MTTYKFSKAVQAFIDTVKDVEATTAQLQDSVKIIETKKVGFNLVTDKILLIAVKALKEGFATIKTAEFIAGTIALEIHEESREAREIKKAAKAENEIVTITTTEAKKDKKSCYDKSMGYRKRSARKIRW